MSLSVYDPVKNCFVLKVMDKPVINAFHPDYMKVHEPSFMKEFRTFEANRQAAATLSAHVEVKRKTKPSHGTLFGISDKVSNAHDMKPKQMMKKPSLEPKEFHVYNKAGAPKTRSELMSAIVAKKRKEKENYGTALHNSKNIPKKRPK